MTLILNNDEITQLLPMADCLSQLDAAYRDLGEGNAISRTRSDIYGPIHDNGRYVFKTMDGMVGDVVAVDLPGYDVAARWLAGLGPDAVVLEPAELADAVRARLRAAAGNVS